MFGSIKQLWAESALTSSVEGVIRESSKGNVLEVQRWYFKFKDEAYKQSLKEGVKALVVEERALRAMEPEQSNEYRGIVQRLSQAGGPLAEVNEWLEKN